MNHFSLKILKYLNKNANENNPISNENLFNIAKCDQNTFETCIEELSAKKYINSIGHTSTKYDILTIESFYWSTNLGKIYFKEKFKSSIKSWIESFIIGFLFPFLVSYITTRITMRHSISSGDICNQCAQTIQDNIINNSR